jgi:hypothetical protein
LNSHTVHKLVYIIPLLLVVGLVQSANAHAQAWWFGYNAGQGAGKSGYTDGDCGDWTDGGPAYAVVSFHGYDVNLTADLNEDRCNDGYTKGWDSTCRGALNDPNAEHDIYGCPGISDKMIGKVMDEDSARDKVSLNSTQIAQQKTECAKLQEYDKQLSASVSY